MNGNVLPNSEGTKSVSKSGPGKMNHSDFILHLRLAVYNEKAIAYVDEMGIYDSDERPICVATGVGATQWSEKRPTACSIFRISDAMMNQTIGVSHLRQQVLLCLASTGTIVSSRRDNVRFQNKENNGACLANSRLELIHNTARSLLHGTIMQRIRRTGSIVHNPSTINPFALIALSTAGPKTMTIMHSTTSRLPIPASHRSGLTVSSANRSSALQYSTALSKMQIPTSSQPHAPVAISNVELPSQETIQDFVQDLVASESTSDIINSTTIEDQSQVNSVYYSPHMGDPCTAGSLDHLLICGHKIVTTNPEDCANNCHIAHSPHANPRSADTPFVCMACITKKIQREHIERVNSFTSELETVARASGKRVVHLWITQKLRVMEVAWRDMELEEMSRMAKEGRFCHAVYIDERYQELARKVLEEQLASDRGDLKTATGRPKAKSSPEVKPLAKPSRLPRQSPSRRKEKTDRSPNSRG